MSWDAGAITGQVILDIGQSAGAIQQTISGAVHAGAALGGMDQAARHAGSALQGSAASTSAAGHALDHAGESAHGFGGDLLHTLGVMEMFRVAAQAAMELPLHLVEKAFDLAKEAARSFFDAIAEGGNNAQKAGLDALKAGVDVSFFSDVAEAAKRVGIGNDELGMSFKFLQRNAADAVDGTNQAAAKGFESIGISTEFLKQHLDDTQGIFVAVKEKIGELATPAERTGAALKVMGRAGSEMVPLFVQSNEEMAESIALGHRLGAAHSQASVEAAEGWVKSKAAFSDMWEGITRAVADPVLEVLNDHWEQVRAAIISFTDTAVAAVPVAMKIIVDAVDPVVAVLNHVLKNVAGLAELFGYWSGNAGLQSMGDHLQSLAEDLDKLRSGLDDVTHSSERFARQWQQNAIHADGRIDTGQGGPQTLNINVHGLTDPGDEESLKRELAGVIKRHHQERQAAVGRQNAKFTIGGMKAIKGLF